MGRPHCWRLRVPTSSYFVWWARWPDDLDIRPDKITTGAHAMSRKPQGGRAAVRFALAIVLTKREAFEACEVCADAERTLLRAGRVAEAARVAALFELFESRMVIQ